MSLSPFPRLNDLLNRIDTIQDTTSGTTNLASYTYLGAGTVIQINYPQPQVWLDLWGSTTGVFTGFDQFNRITNQAWSNYNTSTMLDQYKYGYDQNSNRVWKQNVVGTPVVTGGLDEYYTYDNLNRLAHMQRGTLNGTFSGITGTPSIEQQWTLDATGNWTQYTTLASGSATMTQPRTSNAVNEITAINSVAPPATPPTPWVTPAYDAAGNMTTIPQTNAPTSSYTATYDAWNRLVNVSAGATVASYEYDGRGFRTVRTTPSETRNFYFTADGRDIEQRIGSSSSMDQQHVWGIRYVNEVVCRDGASPMRLYVCQDPVFNVTALVGSMGALAERFLYEAYGRYVVLSGSWSAASDTYDWSRLFQGGQHDPATGIVHFGLREYLPAVWVWAQRDPISLGRLNLYIALSADPLSRVDPSGLDDNTIDTADDALIWYLKGKGGTAKLGDFLVSEIRGMTGYDNLKRKFVGRLANELKSARYCGKLHGEYAPGEDFWMPNLALDAPADLVLFGQLHLFFKLDFDISEYKVGDKCYRRADDLHLHTTFHKWYTFDNLRGNILFKGIFSAATLGHAKQFQMHAEWDEGLESNYSLAVEIPCNQCNQPKNPQDNIRKCYRWNIGAPFGDLAPLDAPPPRNDSDIDWYFRASSVPFDNGNIVEGGIVIKLK